MSEASQDSDSLSTSWVSSIYRSNVTTDSLHSFRRLPGVPQPRSKMVSMVVRCRSAEPCSAFWKVRGLQFAGLRRERQFMTTVLYPLRYFKIVAAFCGIFSIIGISIVAIFDFHLQVVHVDIPDKILLATGFLLFVAASVIAVLPQYKLHRYWSVCAMAIVLICQLGSLIAQTLHVDISSAAFGTSPSITASEFIIERNVTSEICGTSFKDGLYNGTVRNGSSVATSVLAPVGSPCEMDLCNITTAFFAYGISSGIIFFSQFSFSWSYPVMLMLVALPVRLYIFLLILPIVSMAYTLVQALFTPNSHFR